MTEEIIKSITQAEEKAAEIKRVATEKAATIIAEATEKAANTEGAAVDVCRAYKESQIKGAHAEAERADAETIAKNTDAAKSYCANAFAEADAVIGDIVGRIIRGDC